MTTGEQKRSRPHAPGAEASSHVACVAITAVSFGFVAAGIAWPQAASHLLRLLLVAAAVIFTVSRAWRALAYVRHTPEGRSPFNRVVSTRKPPVAPQALRRLSGQLDAAGNAREAPIPWATRRMLIEETSRRLAERHGLDLNDPNHHTHVRSLVSDPTRRLILPVDTTLRDTLSIYHLDVILDDLETL